MRSMGPMPGMPPPGAQFNGRGAPRMTGLGPGPLMAGGPTSPGRCVCHGGWSGEAATPSYMGDGKQEVSVVDVRHAWQFDPAVREALPTEWMKTAYDRWKAKNHAGTDEQDISAGWVIETQKRLREQAEEEAV